MAWLSISQVREKIAEAGETAQTEAVWLERDGRGVAALISPERYDELMTAYEDAQDLALFDAALAEEGPHLTPEQVQAKGLLPPHDLESLKETRALLSDPDAMRRIAEAKAEIARGEVVSVDEVRAELEQRFRPPAS
jgi:antitoxin Phd